MTQSPVGIDQMALYVPPFALSLEALADARQVSRDKIRIGLGAHEMAVAPPWEDTVTLGANAAARLFAGGRVRPSEIGLLLLATETAVDHAKPASIFLHELLELPDNCRTFELKHACYSGTAGVMIAAEWVRSGAARGRKALVVASDIARYDIGSSAEFTQGAGAVALVVGESPRLLELDPVSGVFAKNVYDFWRPLDRREALVDGKFSLDCYLNALEGALSDYQRGTSEEDPQPLTERVAALLYHTPFPKMAYKAHLRLVEHEWKRVGRSHGDLAATAEPSYAALVDPWLAAARRVGNTYTASLYFCLAALAEAGADPTRNVSLDGLPIGLFSYGSGCCAEFFSGRFAAGSTGAARRIDLSRQLAERRELSVREYERFARQGAGGEEATEARASFCHFAGIRDHKRIYERAEHVT